VPTVPSTSKPVIEAVYHHWDARAGREPEATIPPFWAVPLAALLVEFASLIAHRDGAIAAPGRYLFQIGDGVGAMTITVQEGQVRVERGALGTPDVTLHLSADRYARLLAGRLDLARALDSGEVQLEGGRARALELTRIFAGIG
jgi:alkyl sulfatase BDS1-like metallo-beta-lactamase superfamily hydrolase